MTRVGAARDTGATAPAARWHGPCSMPGNDRVLVPGQGISTGLLGILCSCAIAKARRACTPRRPLGSTGRAANHPEPPSSLLLPHFPEQLRTHRAGGQLAARSVFSGPAFGNREGSCDEA